MVLFRRCRLVWLWYWMCCWLFLVLFAGWLLSPGNVLMVNECHECVAGFVLVFALTVLNMRNASCTPSCVYIYPPTPLEREIYIYVYIKTLDGVHDALRMFNTVYAKTKTNPATHS